MFVSASVSPRRGLTRGIGRRSRAPANRPRDQSEGEIDENGVFHCFPPCSWLLRRLVHGRNPKVSAFIGLPLNVCVHFSFAEARTSPAVLLVCNLLHPVDDLAVVLLLDGNVRHGRGGRRAVPMLFSRREPDHIAGVDLFDWSALAPRPAAARR